MSKDQALGKRAARATAQRLESLRRAGVTHLPKRRAASGGSATPGPRKADDAPAAKTGGNAGKDRAAALEAIARRVSACPRCPELVANRTQTVFGVGNPHARLVFMGEAPGADEDRQGEPFVGRAGQLLNKIIAACGMRREDVYILNTIKCRPPNNRAPLPIEAANCREYLDGQLDIIRPEFICCLGAVAAQNLLGTTDSIGKLRGRVLDYQGIKVVCTYHPAYLLRNPDAKRHTWDDMKMLLTAMGLEVPNSRGEG